MRGSPRPPLPPPTILPSLRLLRSPGVLAMASSVKGESSYSYLTDMDIGLSLIDRFTAASLDFFERVGTHSSATIDQLFKIYK